MQKHTNPLITRAGLTLVEILVAMTILATAMAPIFSLFVFAARSSGSSIQRTQAQFLAHAVLEAIKAETIRYPAYLQSLPGVFEVPPVRHNTLTFTRFSRARARSNIEVFNSVHGLNAPINPDSPLYNDFKDFNVIVELTRASKFYEALVKVKWVFEGKNHVLELKGTLDATPWRFTRWSP